MRKCIYVALLFVCLSCKGMSSSLVFVLNSIGQPISTERMVHSSSGDVSLVCYGTQGDMVRRIRESGESDDSLKRRFGRLKEKYHRCHAEVFLLKDISAKIANLEGLTIFISQPYFPCVTSFLEKYYSAGTNLVTEYNPGETCDSWVRRFVQEKKCRVVFQKQGYTGSKESERIYCPSV